MDFKKIEAFVNVVECKSFSKGAEATFLTQPTVSVHIRSLEEELGTTLLNRQGKQVVPTVQGKNFYKYAIEILAIRKKVIDTFHNMSDHLEGVLNIQTSSTPGQDFLPWKLKTFSELNPDVRYFLEQSDTNQVIENLVSGRGEIGFVGSMGSKSLVYEPVFDDEPRLIVSKNRKLGQIEKETLTIEDFIEEPFLWREQGRGSKDAFETFLKKQGYQENALNIVAKINSLGIIRKAVATGLGVSLISSSAIGEKDYMMGIRSYKVRDFERKRTFYMAYRKKAYLSPAAETFKRFILTNK